MEVTIHPFFGSQMKHPKRSRLEEPGTGVTWMSQEVSKWLVSGLQPQYTPFISRL